MFFCDTYEKRHSSSMATQKGAWRLNSTAHSRALHSYYRKQGVLFHALVRSLHIHGMHSINVSGAFSEAITHMHACSVRHLEFSSSRQHQLHLSSFCLLSLGNNTSPTPHFACDCARTDHRFSSAALKWHTLDNNLNVHLDTGELLPLQNTSATWL